MRVSPRKFLLPERLYKWLPYGALVVSVFAVYCNIYHNAFVFDDDTLIRFNTYLLSWSHVKDIFKGSTTDGAGMTGGFYRPLQIFLYLLISRLAAGNIFWFHLLNLSLHAANCCLMYGIGTKLRFNKVGVLLASMMWGLHPLHTEAITYMSGTADPLFSFFCLLSIMFLLPDIEPRKIVMIIPLFLLGLLSKETMAMYPLLVMSCLFYVSPERLRMRTYIRTWPLWMISLIYSLWRLQTNDFDGPRSFESFYGQHTFSNLELYATHPVDRLYTCLASLPSYLELLIWPHDLHMERAFSVYVSPLNPAVMAGIGLILLSLVVLMRSSFAPYKGLEMSWGLLWFAASHAPDSGLLPMNALFLEHWMYLPSVGLFLGIAQTISKRFENSSRALSLSASGVAVLFAIILATKTYVQNQVWRTPETFYINIVAHGERSMRAHNNLAIYYSEQGRNDDAIKQFREATQISDTYPGTQYNLALLYLSMPDREAHLADAIACLKRSIEIDPHFSQSYQLLGDIFANDLHEKAQADIYYQNAQIGSKSLR